MYEVPNIPWTPVDLELIPDKYNNTNNSRVPTEANLAAAEGTYCCYVYPVAEGEVYRIYGKGDSGSHQLYALADSNRYVITGGTPGVAINSRTDGYVIVIPAGVARLVVNLYQYAAATDKVQKIGEMTQVAWGDGSGDNLYLTRQSSAGSGTVMVSSDSNTGAARSKSVSFSSGVGSIVRTLQVGQEAGQLTPHTATETFLLSSYDSVDCSYYSLTNPTRAYTDTSSTNYSTINLTRGSQAETYVYFKFDTSSIPADATIDSVSCDVKIFINNTSSGNVATRTIQMFSGTTAKGSTQNATTSATIRTFSGETWTRSEISDCRVKLYAKRGTSNTDTSYYFRLYGAVLTVTYTYYD